DLRAADRYRRGRYVTLRLTSNMYHRFHAPCDCRIDDVTCISGDTWNVNPVAVARIARLYCKNERAVIHARADGAGDAIAIVAVGAILVGSIHVHFPRVAHYRKGDELGYFHHGSTIIVVTTDGLDLCDTVRPGAIVRMGEPLLRRRCECRSPVTGACHAVRAAASTERPSSIASYNTICPHRA